MATRAFPCLRDPLVWEFEEPSRDGELPQLPDGEFREGQTDLTVDTGEREARASE